ncbi:MAG: hypothetical protein RRY38_00240 [Oscillospiraceae bacterium]
MEGLKIVAGDTAGKGAMSLADTPSLAPERLKRKFDELSLDVLVPAHNALVTVLERDYASLTDVANTVFETGSADMTKAQYDANLNGTVDDSEKLAGKPSSYYASAANAFGNYAHSLALSLDIPAGTTYYKDLADLTKTGTTSQVASRISVSGQETVDGVKYYKLTLDGVATAIRTDAAGTKLYRTHKLSGAGDNVRFVAEGSPHDRRRDAARQLFYHRRGGVLPSQQKRGDKLCKF